MDIDMNKVVHEDITTNMSTSEENKKVLQKEIELLTSHHLVYDEKPLEEECQAMQLNERSSEEKATFSNKKLENEIIINEKGILINEENKCDELNASIMLDTEKIENDSCGISTISNITQSTSEVDDEEAPIWRCHAAAVENVCDIRQETLQKLPEIIECSVSNDTNIVQSKCANDETNDQPTKVNFCNNEIQINDPPSQKQERDRTSLSIIAIEYGDTDSDVEIEAEHITTENQYTVSQIQTQNLEQYRTVKENLSSGEEIDSEDDSDSSSSSSSSDSDSSSNSSSDSSSDYDSDDDANINKKGGSKTNTVKKGKHIQNELDNLPPIEDLQISVPEVLCDPLGKIEKIVEQLVIVKPKSDVPTLNLDTVLFVNKGTKALGKIFDVFGPVNEPYYCIRFNDTKHIEDNDIKVGMQVYYCPSNTSYTSLVFLHELTKIKACDTVGDDEPLAFSDDEEEQAYYEMLKQKNNKDCSNSEILKKRQRQAESCTTMGWQSNHPWNKNRNVRKYTRGRRQNWNGGNRPAHNGPYTYNESWQQYPYQNNGYWHQVPQNMHAMYSSYAGYGISYNESHLLQHSNSDNTSQYYQGTEPNFPSMPNHYPTFQFGAAPIFNPACPPINEEMPYHQFSM